MAQNVLSVMAGLLPMSSATTLDVVSAVAVPGINVERMPVGTVIAWPTVDVPAGWSFCDGASISRADHAELFALLGTSYGDGDGTTTFDLPDLRGRVIVGRDNMGGRVANVIHGDWSRQLGAKSGEEEHQLSLQEMPRHRHYSFGENMPWWSNGVLGPNNNQGPDSGDMDNYLLGTTPEGGDQPHNNIQPSMVMNWIIKG
ncbi:MAG: tail fiber protein [Candidatus Omnitrophica bacterium]|nr:tail fiber protein [Candidatus Omnitrophota bacterium]